jgi:hypothetical protein
MKGEKINRLLASVERDGYGTDYHTPDAWSPMTHDDHWCGEFREAEPPPEEK